MSKRDYDIIIVGAGPAAEGPNRKGFPKTPHVGREKVRPNGEEDVSP